MSAQQSPVAQQAKFLAMTADRLATASTEARRLAERLESATKASEPDQAAAVYHDAIADIVHTLKSSAYTVDRRILGNGLEFQIADATVTVEISSDPDLPEDGDFADPDAAADIRRRVDSGDLAAWCTIAVKVIWRGFTGTERVWGVIMEPGRPVDGILKFANDHGMLGDAVCHLANKVDTAGWPATFPTPEDRDELRLHSSQPVGHI